MSTQNKSGKVPCQSIENLRKKRAALTRKLYCAANSALDCGDVEIAVKAMAQLEKQYQFDRKHFSPAGGESTQKTAKNNEPVTLSIHQGGSVDEQRKHLLERIASARGVSGNRGGSASGDGPAGRVAGAG